VEGRRLVKDALHVGCGSAHLPEWVGSFREVRLDANPDVKPDIVGNMTDLGDVGTFDLVYCSHALEHLCPRDVMVALSEFKRVLRPSGAAMIFVPDLEDIKPTWDMVYMSELGPICGHDMFYGHTAQSEISPYMRHLSGFVAHTLESALKNSGYREVVVRRMPGFNLFGVGIK
jgi:ubiquinone/menaquinone biosynthesis C-methylase UbiE